MKTILVQLAAVVIAATLATQPVVTAEVTRVNANKGHVYVNKGKPAGFVVGAQVCILSGPDKELACGTIFRTTDAYSVVRVDKQPARYIRQGMTANLMTESAGEQ